MSARLSVEQTPLAGLMVITRNVLSDHRGYLERLFCTAELARFLDGREIAQINHTLTRNAGAARGMHFQRQPFQETKIVSCLRGEVFDVAVDLRKGSATFGKWYGTVLSADNHSSLYIPEGFAHGFQTLCSDCELIYFHSAPYSAEAEGAVNMLDPAFGIEWPMAITERSTRDESHPFITSAFEGLET
ncbi:dTDP-4-dehydrorhamnose 3,5-epimerase family protein [Mesorhizobium dulcispinae]|uniref:dTDP-4-dehydrorhamnose 3,5-epimerase family protein n=1 Tax=Mesorhizobium dulcispinae TaxID=3072316 RepID=UPI002A24A4F6|nr:dTDP-4-dehydrorhamnose 3,5-epimerase family protein [Mesorhizobium sp. VK23D]MDX8516964.1 dTDP-4-dehydrorhamnose 3,5-epimerase family protein [Mesorhizobium sp. VK23D]